MPQRLLLKLTLPLVLVLAIPAFAAEPFAVLQLVGIPGMKQNEKAKMTVENGAMQLKYGKSSSEVKASSIEDIFTGTETTQGGGRTGTAAKTGAIAAPYGTGAVLVLMLRTTLCALANVANGWLRVPAFMSEPVGDT